MQGPLSFKVQFIFLNSLGRVQLAHNQPVSLYSKHGNILPLKYIRTMTLKDKTIKPDSVSNSNCSTLVPFTNSVTRSACQFGITSLVGKANHVHKFDPDGSKTWEIFYSFINLFILINRNIICTRVCNTDMSQGNRALSLCLAVFCQLDIIRFKPVIYLSFLTAAL